MRCLRERNFEGNAGFLTAERIEENELASLEGIIAREVACLQDMNPKDFMRLDGEFHEEDALADGLGEGTPTACRHNGRQ